MSKSVATPVSAKFIRTAFAEGKFTAPDEALPSLVGSGANGARGRLNPLAVEAFLAQVPGHTYAEKTVKPEATVTIVPTRKDKNGRVRSLKAREVSVSEVRRLAGGPARGRLSAATIAKAAEALGAK